MILKKESKRLGVFVFFDKDSIIDDYVLYMLDSLNEAVDKILFISNSKLNKKELEKLQKYDVDINIRENKGLDAGAFKYTYDKYGKSYFTQYDELILLNDTFFGPFVPFKEIINKMNEEDLDFWGLTPYYESVDGTGKSKDGFIHTHIQTYFVAYRKSILLSDFFNNYWSNYSIEMNNNFENVVNNHETYFTYLLEKEGFKWDTYMDLKRFCSDNREYNYNLYGYSSYSLLKYYNCPFFKRKNFVFSKRDALYLNSGLDTKKSLEWIVNNTNYDVNMIYKNICRLYDPVDLYQSLNYNFIIKTDKEENTRDSLQDVLILVNIKSSKVLELTKGYFDQLHNTNIVFVNDKNTSAINYIQHNKKSIITKYKYVCILNLDCDNNNFQEVSDSNIIRTLDNAIFNRNYINNIINIFKEKNIGILYLPESIHNRYIMNITGKNGGDISKEMHYSGKYDKVKHMIKSFDGIWIRSELLNNSLLKENINDRQFIFMSEVLLKDTNYMIGKIYNQDYIENDILCLETVINSFVNSKEIELSYPNKMTLVSNTRMIFRNTVPLGVRERLKSLFKL